MPVSYGENTSTASSVLGTLAFIIVWPFIAFNISGSKWIKGFVVSRPIVAMFGGALMVIVQAISQDDVYLELGARDRLQTIYLLLGMMLIGRQMEQEEIITDFLRYLLPHGKTNLRHALWRVCPVVAATAALITNDAACLLLAPLVVAHCQEAEFSARDLEVMLVAVSTSANIGSAATVFGNPQLAVIAARGGLTLADTFLFVTPVAVVSVIINTFYLSFIYNNPNWRSIFRRATTGTADMEAVRPAEDIALEDRGLSEEHRSDSNEQLTPAPASDSAADADHAEHTLAVHTAPAAAPPAIPHRRAFRAILAAGMAAVVVLLAIPHDKASFDLGLVPVGVGTLCLIVDGILNKRGANTIIAAVDWGLLLMFSGLFVWLLGFEETGLPTRAWAAMQGSMSVDTFAGMLLFAIFILVGSNIISNVPLVVLVVDRVVTLSGSHYKYALVSLAWLSTVAGNITLFGSICNLIAAEKGKPLGVNIGTKAFLRLLPCTLFITTLGQIIIFGICYSA